MTRVAALVLAAGLSRRFSPGHKLLAPVGGTSVIRVAVDAIAASRVDSVTAVLGHEAGRIGAELVGTRARLVWNARHADGMASSIAAGLASLEAASDGLLLCLGDMPLIQTETIDRLLDAFGQALETPGSPASPIVLPTYRGARGHPVLWHHTHVPALASLSGDKGGRELLHEHAGSVITLHVDDPGVRFDVDTADLLAAMRRHLQPPI